MNFEPVKIATKEDFKLGSPVKWCAGCGGHSVLSSVMNVLPETGISKENVVFVSGIGCSSRFPYYINTYGLYSHISKKKIRNPYYLNSLIGKLNYILNIEPDNTKALKYRNDLIKLDKAHTHNNS